MYDSLVNRPRSFRSTPSCTRGTCTRPMGQLPWPSQAQELIVPSPPAAPRSGSLCSAGRCLLERSQATSLEGPHPRRRERTHFHALHPSRKVEGGQTLFGPEPPLLLRRIPDRHTMMSLRSLAARSAARNLAERDVDRFGARPRLHSSGSRTSISGGTWASSPTAASGSICQLSANGP